MRYYDTHIISERRERIFSKDKNGDCNPIEKVVVTSELLLKYNWSEYK